MTTPGATTDAPLLIRTDGGVRTLMLNRPAAFNSFNEELKAMLLPAVRDAAADPAVRVLVLTGVGRAFCAGQDLKEHLAKVERSDPTLVDTVRAFYSPLITEIVGMRKPVVAAVNGTAAGAGAALTFACDLRIAASTASFSMAFANAGLAADSGASYTLPRLVGAGRALRMLLLGTKVTAADAHAMGLVDEIVAVSEFTARVDEVASALAAGPTDAFGWIKASVWHASHADLASALAFEDTAQAACFASPDHREALEAFAAKRPPVFGTNRVG